MAGSEKGCGERRGRGRARVRERESERDSVEFRSARGIRVLLWGLRYSPDIEMSKPGHH